MGYWAGPPHLQAASEGGMFKLPNLRVTSRPSRFKTPWSCSDPSPPHPWLENALVEPRQTSPTFSIRYVSNFARLRLLYF